MLNGKIQLSNGGFAASEYNPFNTNGFVDEGSISGLSSDITEYTARTPEPEQDCVIVEKELPSVIEIDDPELEQDCVIVEQQAPSVTGVDMTNGHVDLGRLNRKWTQEELNLLFELGCKIILEGGTWEEIAQQLHRSVDRCKRQFSFLKKNFEQPPGFWIPEKQELLLSLYEGTALSWDEIAERIGCHRMYCMDKLLNLIEPH